MRLLIKPLFILTVVLLPAVAIGQSVFTVGGQYKPRFEYRNGFKTPILETQNPAYFVEQRARIYVDYTTDKFQIHFNIQDVRMWGATNQIYKADGLASGSLTNLYEAYGTYFINNRWSVKIGRQELDYDHARFLGNLDWAMQGRSHDALLFRCNNPDRGMKIHVGGALNQFQFEPFFLTAAPYIRINYKNMAFIWANKTIGNFNVSFLFHNNGQEALKLDVNGDPIYTGVEYHRQTIGLVPTFSNDNVEVGGEFYFQTGKNFIGQDISAYLLNAYFTLKTDLTPITVGVDFASGTQWDADSLKDNSWNPLYGTNHKFYGVMDYFYVANPHGQARGRSGGLIDLHVKTNFRFAEKHSLAVAIHYFMSPVAVIDRTEFINTNTVKELSTGLGTEIDLVYQVALTKGVAGFVGYSQMFATESMNNIKGSYNLKLNLQPTLTNTSGLNNWAWVGLNFTGELFKHSK